MSLFYIQVSLEYRQCLLLNLGIFKSWAQIEPLVWGFWVFIIIATFIDLKVAIIIQHLTLTDVPDIN